MSITNQQIRKLLDTALAGNDYVAVDYASIALAPLPCNFDGSPFVVHGIVTREECREWCEEQIRAQEAADAMTDDEHESAILAREESRAERLQG